VSRRILGSRLLRIALVVVAVGGVAAAFWFHGPDWDSVGDAFASVQWEWVVAAIGINLLSIVARSIAWKLVIDQAMPPPRPGYALTFSAFSVGLLANAVLPGRIGELARVAVLARRFPDRTAAGATLLGTVFAHRLFDLVPVGLLILYVLGTAKIPAWATTSLVIIVAVGAGLFVFAFLSASHHRRTRLEGLGGVQRMVTMARFGLGVMHRPLPAAGAIFFQCVGWVCQLFAVYTTMLAFGIDAPVPAAALVLLVMNVVTILPLWPGNIGAVQVAIGVALVPYGVAYGTGVAFGFGLQAIEASVGVGVGLVFLAREGLTFGMLRRMPGAATAEVPEDIRPPGEADGAEGVEHARARMSG
jgi:uncharacterized membrane protein YbhN (UPF0104 family)